MALKQRPNNAKNITMPFRDSDQKSVHFFINQIPVFILKIYKKWIIFTQILEVK